MRSVTLLAVLLFALPAYSGELEDLRAEVERLRAELKAAQERIAELEAEVGKADKAKAAAANPKAADKQVIMRGFESIPKALPKDIVPNKSQRETAEFSQVHRDRIVEAFGSLAKATPRIELVGEIASLPEKALERNALNGDPIPAGYIVLVRRQGDRETKFKHLGLPWEFMATVSVAAANASQIDDLAVGDAVKVTGRIREITLDKRNDALVVMPLIDNGTVRVTKKSK